MEVSSQFRIMEIGFSDLFVRPLRSSDCAVRRPPSAPLRHLFDQSTRRSPKVRHKSYRPRLHHLLLPPRRCSLHAFTPPSCSPPKFMTAPPSASPSSPTSQAPRSFLPSPPPSQQAPPPSTTRKSPCPSAGVAQRPTATQSPRPHIPPPARATDPRKRRQTVPAFIAKRPI